MPSQTTRLSSINSVKSTPRQARWDRGIPPPLRPIVRAYLLGYGFTVGPRVLTLLVYHASKFVRGSQRRASNEDATAQKKPVPSFGEALSKILKAGLEVNRFATFSAAIVGGSTLLEPILEKAFARILGNLSDTMRTRLSRYFSSAIAAYFSIQLLQTPLSTHTGLITSTKPEYNPVSGQTITTPTKPTSPPQAGRTLDLTLFAATRALDVIIGELWAQRRTHIPPSPLTLAPPIRTLDRLLSNLTDPIIFALTSGIVMWNWFYSPHSLPRAYNKWIASAAAVDERLVLALQRCRSNDIRYGEDTGQATLLQGMCEEYKFPLAWGDPAVSVPYPCEMVHMGSGPVCEVYALSRFRRAWLWSMKTYVPLQMIMFLIRVRSSKNIKRDLLRTLLSASRSSAFLGSFITLFYYSICLARTRVGPLILGKSVEARQKIDGGICVGLGCFLCGWSILLETPSRRKELALFVAPRAVATLLPRRYDAQKQWMERLVFATSTAVVFTCVLENKRRVRGVVGGVLRMLLAA